MMNEVKLIDCMEYMKTVPDKYYQLSIVDPPYGIGFDRENTSMSAGERKDGTKRNMKSWSNPRPTGYAVKEWDSKRPGADYFNELMRVSKNQIVWGGNYFTDILPPSGGWVVWEKGVPDGMSLSQAELAWTQCLNSIKIARILWAGYKKAEQVVRIHPTQKPVALYKWLLKNYAKPNDKIFDSHVGSGSIRIACHDMGFDFMGCELDPDYWKAQEERYKQHTMQGDLFSGSDLQSSILGGTL